MNTRVFLAAVIFLAGSASAIPARAKMSTDYGDFSATVTAVSDYRYRGVSRSDERPAIQGSIDWSNPYGLYLGFGASNVDFDEAAHGYLELAAYGGYKWSVSGVNVNTGFNYFDYPGEATGEHYEYLEGKVILDHDFGVADMNLGIRISPNYYDNTGLSEYPSIGFVAPIARTGVFFTGSYGHLWVEKRPQTPDYSDWSVGFAYKWQGFDFAARYVDNSITSGRCPQSSSCDATGVFSISRTF
jgi:uncharacterized protein (TIGR02001 family)